MIQKSSFSASQAIWRGLLVTIVFFLLCALAQSILINPTLENVFKFPAMKGELEYSYFTEHPPILSLDEKFLLVLSTFSVSNRSALLNFCVLLGSPMCLLVFFL